MDVWLGTTTPRDGESRGIYHVTIDLDSGKLSRPRLAAELGSPGFLALHPRGDTLYSLGIIDGEGSVCAFRFERDGTGTTLQRTNSQPIGGGKGTHLSMDRSGGVLLCAQYSAGTVAAFPIEPDGTIGPRSEFIKHDGASRVVPGRQDAPHPHWIGTDADNRYVFVPDLGLDQVVIYKLDTASASLRPHGHATVPPGSGPRHMKFHPNRPFAFVLNEMTVSVSAFRYNKDEGSLTEIQTVDALPNELRELDNSASEIRIHPSGKYLYTGNRGHDSISAFRIDEESGRLTFLERESIRGSWPRNFDITPDGKWLLAAGRDSNTLAVFRIDADTGHLIYSRHIVNVPSPICVLVGPIVPNQSPN